MFATSHVCLKPILGPIIFYVNAKERRSFAPACRRHLRPDRQHEGPAGGQSPSGVDQDFRESGPVGAEVHLAPRPGNGDGRPQRDASNSAVGNHKRK